MSVHHVVKKMAALQETACLGDDENPFSTNKVTGWSLNFPIAGTCNPTKVCAKTCYFAKGPSTWTPSLRKQQRLQNRLDHDWKGLARQIVYWARRLKLDFVRWHGGGDMTKNSAMCIDEVATHLGVEGVPQWVVTRIPSLAAEIKPRPNVFVHISTDKSSMDRLRDFAAIAPHGLQWFWSYQCDAGEVPTPDVAPVIFRNCYKPSAGESAGRFDCPLNWSDDICGECERCRRCFDGSAVRDAVTIATRQDTSAAEATK